MLLNSLLPVHGDFLKSHLMLLVLQLFDYNKQNQQNNACLAFDLYKIRLSYALLDVVYFVLQIPFPMLLDKFPQRNQRPIPCEPPVTNALIFVSIVYNSSF